MLNINIVIKMNVYYIVILEMDNMCVDIIEFTANMDISNNTFTFFISSNGPEIKYNINDDSSTWEGGIRVPFIGNWTNYIKLQSHSHDIISIYDIFVTLINIFNATFIIK